MLRIFRYIAAIIVLLAAGIFILNTNLLAPASAEKPMLIAHRGLGQTFHREGLTGETCTAERIFPPEHDYLENTIEGFAAAFEAGADMVEFDIHPTTDGHFVVFHDWTLDCRTDGHGVTRDHSLAELKSLDIGYGYTADNGKSFPFRGKGAGMMPTLDEVLFAFADKRFLINIKSDDPEEGKRLAEKLSMLPPEHQDFLTVYGGGAAIDALHQAMPSLRVLGTDNARKCLVRYALLGWSTIVPESCRNTLFMIPTNVAPFAWGYPDRLIDRLRQYDTTVVLLGAYDGSGFSSGVDDGQGFADVPARFDGAVWTNRIDRIGPLSRSLP
ncbi:glycerophosphodiester phosphodiesterase family protein [Bauldia sp.]|uniref:glycerophosphodiester phosphodiesterase family protein n=1 Tax=Bauldia sp. TaxID=2575872 RepID=UPI0025C36D53|nr:glycerophosphodiester phosphodiesterase family protein [Bauldia sp.]